MNPILTVAREVELQVGVTADDASRAAADAAVVNDVTGLPPSRPTNTADMATQRAMTGDACICHLIANHISRFTCKRLQRVSNSW